MKKQKDMRATWRRLQRACRARKKQRLEAVKAIQPKFVVSVETEYTRQCRLSEELAQRLNAE
jgi:hypothetical protein